MNRMSRLAPALVAVALLAACTGPQSIPVERGVDVPAELQPDGFLGDSGPRSAWDGGRDAFVVVVYGSSSCAPIPTELTLDDERTLALRFAENPGEVCTADMAANTYRFDTPEGVAPDGEVELAMTFEDDGDQSVETVPIVG